MAQATNQTTNTCDWVLDSGATSHFARNRADFIHYQPLDPPESLTLGNGTEAKILGVGSVELHTKLGGKATKVTLKTVYHVPKIITNLISLTSLLKSGISTTSTRQSLLFTKDNQLVLEAHL